MASAVGLRSRFLLQTKRSFVVTLGCDRTFYLILNYRVWPDLLLLERVRLQVDPSRIRECR
jgi:hypothetical protein